MFCAYHDYVPVESGNVIYAIDPYVLATSCDHEGDHPNGVSFLAYPEICALLMSRDYRREALKRVPEKLRERCSLPDLDREYTLNEIAIVTRAGPARCRPDQRPGGATHGGDRL